MSLGLEKYLAETTHPHEGESTSSEDGEIDKTLLEDSTYTLDHVKQKMKEAYNATLNTLGIGNSEVVDKIAESTSVLHLKQAFSMFTNYTGSIPNGPSSESPIKKSKVEIHIWEDFGDLIQF